MKKARLLLLCLLLISLVVTPVGSILTLDGSSIVEAAKINQKSINLIKSQTYKLKISGTSKTVRWSSSNKSVATVNSSGKVKAKKAGTATIKAKVGKKTYTCKVNVRDTVDLFIFMGQSNMTGRGTASQAPSLYDGAGYEYKTVNNKLSILSEPFGKGQNSGSLSNYNMETGSLVTAFANEYYEDTGIPIVAVAATRVGSGSGMWSTTYVKEAASRYKETVSYLKKKGIKVRNKYMVWYQGENDVFAFKSGSTYKKEVKQVYKTMKKAGVSKCLLIRIGLKSYPTKKAYKAILKAQTNLCKKNSNFVLISTKATRLKSKYFQSDGIHLTQAGLNLVGANAGYFAAKYSKTKKDPSMKDGYLSSRYKAIR